MESCQEQCEQLRREEKVREREKSKEISEQLKQLCEGGTCSLEHIQGRRKEFTLELEEMRRLSEVSRTREFAIVLVYVSCTVIMFIVMQCLTREESWGGGRQGTLWPPAIVNTYQSSLSL